MSTNPVTKAIGPGTTNASQTLYERIGGEPKLDAVVTGVYNAMKADKEIGKLFSRFRLERLKDRTVDYLRGEWGGSPYKGPDLWISHSHMGVNNHWYDIMMKYYVQQLKKDKIGKAEAKECLESLERMRAPIVDRDLKFKNLYLKHVEKEAAKAGGDGWGTVAVSREEREAKEKATLEQIALQKQKDMEEEEERKKLRAWEAGEDTKKAAAKAAELAAPAEPPANPPQAEGEAQRTPRLRTTPRAKPKPPAVDPALFVFRPLEDAPPADPPSSLPSGAELLYRLSQPCLVR